MSRSKKLPLGKSHRAFAMLPSLWGENLIQPKGIQGADGFWFLSVFFHLHSYKILIHYLAISFQSSIGALKEHCNF